VNSGVVFKNLDDGLARLWSTSFKFWSQTRDDVERPKGSYESRIIVVHTFPGCYTTLLIMSGKVKKMGQLKLNTQNSKLGHVETVVVFAVISFYTSEKRKGRWQEESSKATAGSTTPTLLASEFVDSRKNEEAKNVWKERVGW
jgi:hypothetical protein